MKRKTLVVALVLAVFAAVPLSALVGDTHAKAPTPLRISMGRKVTLADYLVTGKTTVFDFTSEFCPPCRAIAPRLAQLHAKRSDLAVVSVDINQPGVQGIDWKSPVARQFDLHSIPHFKIYGPDGNLVAEGDQARAMINAWIK
jgi:thiol-disulfide isomerase/thioredoxin